MHAFFVFRDWPQTQASSLFGIILAAFRFFLRGWYTQVDTTHAKRIRKSTEAGFVVSLLTRLRRHKKVQWTFAVQTGERSEQDYTQVDSKFLRPNDGDEEVEEKEYRQNPNPNGKRHFHPILSIHKWTQKLVFGCVGQPLNLSPRPFAHLLSTAKVHWTFLCLRSLAKFPTFEFICVLGRL